MKFKVQIYIFFLSTICSLDALQRIRENDTIETRRLNEKKETRNKI